jgi:hypothetical protein
MIFVGKVSVVSQDRRSQQVEQPNNTDPFIVLDGRQRDGKLGYEELVA